jgi:hypothetical protein
MYMRNLPLSLGDRCAVHFLYISFQAWQ